jgi:hypothetical protein
MLHATIKQVYFIKKKKKKDVASVKIHEIKVASRE